MANLLSRHGVPVITAAISPYKEIRNEAREMMDDRFIEVYAKASVEVCEERDVKGLYAKARSGEIKEFTGVSDPYEPPENAEIVIETETPVAGGVGSADPHVPGGARVHPGRRRRLARRGGPSASTLPLLSQPNLTLHPYSYHASPPSKLSSA